MALGMESPYVDNPLFDAVHFVDYLASGAVLGRQRAEMSRSIINLESSNKSCNTYK